MESFNNDGKVEISFNEKKQEIFEKIVSYAWAKAADSIKKTIFLLALTYIRSERIEDTEEPERSQIAWHLEVLQWLIDDLRRCELEIKTIEEKKVFFGDNIIGFSCCWNDPDLLPGIKNTLSLLSLDYIRCDEIKGEPKDERENVSFNLYLLNSLVCDIHAMIFEAE